jgi:DNA-binding GntR family transcriptional regulator
MNGELKAGEKLRLDILRKSLGVSLSPLREALSRLGSEGLVLIEDQRGYRVAPVSADNLQEIICLRLICEPLALTHSIEKGDDAWEELLVASLHTLQKYDRLGRNTPQAMEAWERAHKKFHAQLIGACGMPVLLQFCSRLHDLSDRYRRLFLRETHSAIKRNVPEEHRLITESALRGDVKGACTHLREHIQTSKINISNVLSV